MEIKNYVYFVGFVGKVVNEGNLRLPQGRNCYEGDWSKMREPPPNGGALAIMDAG